jgi:hypothetical protein
MRTGRSLGVLGGVVLSSALLLAGKGGTDRPMRWSAAGDFATQLPPALGEPIVFSGVTHGLKVPHLGLASIEFEILAVAVSPTEVMVIGGTFSFTAASGELLDGVFVDGALDLPTGNYFLKFEFAGGTGRFADATGAGRTDGVADLLNGMYSAENFARISY